MENSPVIIGSGIAGLCAAITLAPASVTIIAKNSLGENSSSVLAQGGIAAAIGDGDCPEMHATDTIATGDGLCDEEIARLVSSCAPDAIKFLERHGVFFDADSSGKLVLGLEGGHGRRRIVHACGDGTGLAVMKALAAKARKTPSINIIEDATVVELLTEDGEISGVRIRGASGEICDIAAARVLISTGGAGDLWQNTTNPQGSRGYGIAMAARAGAVLRDLEFVQFHPTALLCDESPMPLLSEALRGEGAFLVNDLGERFMANEPMKDLSPRDIVSMKIHEQATKGRRAFLDSRNIDHFEKRFPAILAKCLSHGINPKTDLLPVSPAAHYHMGGIAVDKEGKSSVSGLWACGEAACTGLHGANRLASNSLLESVIFGSIAAKSMAATITRSRAKASSSAGRIYYETAEEMDGIKKTMSSFVGISRNEEGLIKAVDRLCGLSERSNAAFAAYLIASSALARKESRGAHFRTDFPKKLEEWRAPLLRREMHSANNPISISSPRWNKEIICGRTS